MAARKRQTCCDAGPERKRLFREVDALSKLKRYGDLAEMMRSLRGLSRPVKKLLEQISSDELDVYFKCHNQGLKLFATICRYGDFDDVRYAVKVLRLGKLPPVNTSLSGTFYCPVYSAICSDKRKLSVITYLLKSGCTVSKWAFLGWTQISCDKTELRDLLQLLVEFGRHKMPSTSDLLNSATSQHIDILNEFVQFTLDDMRKVAYRGIINAVDQMSARYPAETEKDRNQLADIFELCEVSRHFHSSSGSFKELTYFRKSLLLRQGPKEKKKRIYFGQWRLFESIEDIERLEKQLGEEDYLETNWQILVTCFRLGWLPRDMYFRFFQRSRIDKLKELADIKSFMLCPDIDLSHTFAQHLSQIIHFLRFFENYCFFILNRTPRHRLSVLSDLYSCYMAFNIIYVGAAVFAQRTCRQRVLRYFQNLVLLMDTSNLDEQLYEIRKWHDESLFVLAVLYDPALPNELIEELMLQLLQRGASINWLPGQVVSAFFLILKDSCVSVSLREELIARTCCRMETSLERLAAHKINVPHLKVFRLRCLAAATCRQLFSEDVLKRDLPASLVPIIYHHPVRSHFNENWSRRALLEKVARQNFNVEHLDV